MNTATPTYPVSKTLWDAMDSVFSAKSRELIKDIAKTLHQDEKKLLQAFRSKKREAYLVDMTEPTNERFQCSALCPSSKVAKRCLKPVVFGEKYCPNHQSWKEDAIYQSIPSLQRIKTETEEDTLLFVDALTGIVYDDKYVRQGFQTEDNVYIFRIEEES
jgi:hypothetical protein